MFQLPPSCRAHREALVEFVDRRRPQSVPVAALDHLDRCPRCTADLTEIALTIAALRQLARDIALVDAPPTAWTGIRARLQRLDGAATVAVEPPARLRSGFLAAITGLALVGTIVTAIAVRELTAGATPLPATLASWTAAGDPPIRPIRSAHADGDLALTNVVAVQGVAPDGPALRRVAPGWAQADPAAPRRSSTH